METEEEELSPEDAAFWEKMRPLLRQIGDDMAWNSGEPDEDEKRFIEECVVTVAEWIEERHLRMVDCGA